MNEAFSGDEASLSEGTLLETRVKLIYWGVLKERCRRNFLRPASMQWLTGERG